MSPAVLQIGLHIFQFAVDESISKLDETNCDYDSTILETAWGLDCEWRPSHLSGEENPIAVLQISSGSRAFVIDVQSLLQHGIKKSYFDLTDSEIAFSEIFTKLFRNPHVKILGFGIGQDLTKLAMSFPHINCFQEFNGVIDIQAVSRHAYPRTSKQFMSSLQKAVAILLGKRLDKREQCSEWDFRPLRPS